MNTEQVPSRTWVIVPPNKRTIARGYKFIRTKASLDHGTVEEKGYRIVSLERAILEGLKFITKIGEKTAIKAARDALAKRQTTELKLGKVAQSFSTALGGINTKSLERGWLSATASVPDEPQFKTAFNTIIKLINDMEKVFLR